MALASDAECWYLIVSKTVFVMLCIICCNMSIYQNVNHLILTEAGFWLFEIKLMQLLSDNKTDFTKLISILVLFFQIQNDYSNLCVEEVTSELSVLDG